MARPRKLPSGMCKRGGAYYSAFRANGRLVRKRLSTDFKAACEVLNELRARADKADFNLVDNDYPFVELKAQFLRWARQSGSQSRRYEADLTRIESYTPINAVRQITQDFVIGYREWRLSQFLQGRHKLPNGQTVPLDRKVCPRTVNREVGTLNNLLNKGVEWKRLGSNPIQGLKRLPHDTPRKERRALDVAEVERIFAASPARLRPVWCMFAETAIRLSELVSLLFSDIDFERQIMTIRAAVAKNHKAREIPITDGMLVVLASLRDEAKRRCPVKGSTSAQTAQQAKAFTREHVFVTRANTPLKNNLLTRFYGICAKAGIEGAHPRGSVDIHAMRGTCATLMLQNGANPKDVQAILGHSTLAMTMNIYAKATERGKRSAIGALPFAKVSAPAHVVSMPGVPKVCATNSEATQALAISGVA